MSRFFCAWVPRCADHRTCARPPPPICASHLHALATGPVGAPTSGRWNGCWRGQRVQSKPLGRALRANRGGVAAPTSRSAAGAARSGRHSAAGTARSRSGTAQHEPRGAGAARHSRDHTGQEEPPERAVQGRTRGAVRGRSPDRDRRAALALRPAPCYPDAPAPARPHSRECWRWIRWIGRGSCWLPGSRS